MSAIHEHSTVEEIITCEGICAEILAPDADKFGRRTRMTPTRAGLVSETFYVCYTCSAELGEAGTIDHACEGYCEHGTYVGGVMEDFMCGWCEA